MPRFCRLIAVVATLLLSGACRNSPADHIKRAEGFTGQKKYKEAILEYRAALQQNAQLGDARLKLADLYAQLDDTANAYREYIRAADTLPDNADAQLKAGAMLLMGNRLAEAKAKAETVLKVSPRNAAALMLLGNALAGLNDVSGAFQRLNEAIEADPGSGLGYSNLGALQLARGDKQMAEASFKKAVNASPSSVTARIALAQYYRSQSRIGDSEAALKEALAIDPKNVQVNSNLVELFIRTDRPREAELPLKTIADVLQNPDSQFALVEYYARSHRSKEAVPLLQKLAATKEYYALATARLAALNYTEGNAAEAHSALDQILKKEPKNREALLLKGQILALEKKYDPALGYLKSAAAAEPARAADANLVTAKIYQATGQFEEAQDTYKKVLTQSPRSVPAQVALSQLYAAKGEIRSAAELARGAVASDPNSTQAHLTLARTLIAAGDKDGAEKEIKLLRENLPPSANLEVQLGSLFVSRNDPVAARSAFTKALSLASGSPEALAGLVGLDLASKNESSAIGRLEARLRDAPDDKNAWFLAAHMYLRLKDTPRAEKALLKSIELNPTNLRAFAMLGGVYGAQGRMDEALKLFESWAARQPRSVAAHTMVAMLLERQNKMEESRKAYEKVLTIDPHAPIAANNLAWYYADSGGNLDLALQLAQTAKAQVPDEPEFNDTLGWVYYKQDILDQSIPLFLQAIDKDPTNAQFQYHLGMAYAKQGEDTKAIAALRKALALNPTFVGAGEAKRMLGELTVS
jgi:tetratricopeptide (TPR) repeat protein